MTTRGNQIGNQTAKKKGGNGRPSKPRHTCGTFPAQERAYQGLMRIAPAYYIGRQKGIDGIEDFDLYNLTEEILGHPQGSTVSGRTLEAAGFRLPPRVPNRAHERAVAQVRRLLEISSR